MRRTIKATVVAGIVAGSLVGSLGMAAAGELASGGGNGATAPVTVYDVVIPGYTIPGYTVPSVPLPGSSGGTLEINGQKHTVPPTPPSTPSLTVPSTTVPATTISGGTLTFRFRSSEWSLSSFEPVCAPGKTPIGFVLSPRTPGAELEAKYVQNGGTTTTYLVDPVHVEGEQTDVTFSICR